MKKLIISLILITSVVVAWSCKFRIEESASVAKSGSKLEFYMCVATDTVAPFIFSSLKAAKDAAKFHLNDPKRRPANLYCEKKNWSRMEPSK